MVSRDILSIFSAIYPLDRGDSTSYQIYLSSPSHPYPNRPLKVTKKFPVFRVIQTFGAQSRPNSGEFEANDSRLLIMAKISSK